MDYQDIILRTDDGIATVTLNRPEKLNAFRQQTIIEMADALMTASKDRSTGVILIAAAGNKAFSVGGDISEMKSLSRKTGAIFVKHLLKLGKTFFDCPKPIIAKVDGYCIGGGNEIQLFCDLTYASDRSVFGQTGPKVGSAPLWGGTQILPLLVGLKKSKELTFLCQHYSAKEAEDMGMINKSVPEDQLDETVQKACQEILAKSPQSLRLLKKSFHEGLFAKLKKDLTSLTGIYGSPELKEGMGAFLEKRTPKFRMT